jgi:hypothetical protein
MKDVTNLVVLDGKEYKATARRFKKRLLLCDAVSIGHGDVTGGGHTFRKVNLANKFLPQDTQVIFWTRGFFMLFLFTNRLGRMRETFIINDLDRFRSGFCWAIKGKSSE